jgi:hypothetical protein
MRCREGEPEVGGDSDMRAPASNEREEWGGGSGPAAGLVGWKRRWAGGEGRKKIEGGLVGLGREERERGLGKFSLFFKPFQTHFSNF